MAKDAEVREQKKQLITTVGWSEFEMKLKKNYIVFITGNDFDIL